MAYIYRRKTPPNTIQQALSAMRGTDLALTCKAAFEAFENSECRSLQTELDKQVVCIRQLQCKINELDEEVLFLDGSCAILATRLV